MGTIQCTPTLFVPYSYIGSKQCRGTLNGPYSIEEAIFFSVNMYKSLLICFADLLVVRLLC